MTDLRKWLEYDRIIAYSDTDPERDRDISGEIADAADALDAKDERIAELTRELNSFDRDCGRYQARIAELEKTHDAAFKLITSHETECDRLQAELEQIKSAESEQCVLVAQDLEAAQARVGALETINKTNAVYWAEATVERDTALERVKELEHNFDVESKARESHLQHAKKLQARVEELEKTHDAAFMLITSHDTALDTAQQRLREVVKIVTKLNPDDSISSAGVYHLIELVMKKAGFTRCGCGGSGVLPWPAGTTVSKDCPCAQTDPLGWVLQR